MVDHFLGLGHVVGLIPPEERGNVPGNYLLTESSNSSEEVLPRQGVEAVGVHCTALHCTLVEG
jgi:hypothetical protein